MALVYALILYIFPLQSHYYNKTKDLFKYSESVDVEVKGKGTMQTYFLS